MNFVRKMIRAGRYAPALAATTGICYLALKPYPARAQIPAMPSRLGAFLDRHDFLCNIAGYLVLTLIMHATFTRWRSVNGLALAIRTTLLCALVTLLETAQRFIPHRNFDPQDIVAGTLGVLLATLPWIRFRRPGFRENQTLVSAVE